ncbi:MAG: FecR domain-containing protein [Pontiellaceae bacterium]|jgi:Tfp pilus assembly protein PilF|nr:FecR domain-containing protein [Pontiellaceae bacterium]
MKRNKFSWDAPLFFCLLSVAAITFSENGADAFKANDAVVLTIEGRVETVRTGTTDWLPAQTNEILEVGDRLRTGLRSRATVRLSDLTVLRVNELTTLKIQPPSQPEKQPALHLEKGGAYFFSRERPVEMEFRTPLASGAIRGTEFNLTVADDGQTVVTLLDGEVELNNESGTVNLVSGEQGIVEHGKAPAKTAVINAINIIQWCLYYPAVLDLNELNFSGEEKELLAASLAAYRVGDLPSALETYPPGRTPVSDAETVYFAQLLLSVGQVNQAETLLASRKSPLANALRTVIASVKFQPFAPAVQTRSTASFALAGSYYLQSRSQLDAARSTARAATQKAPGFGFAWERLAELEFSFGRTEEAFAALEKSLQLSPRNAQALALKGFLLAAQNKITEAGVFFDQAVALDGSLGNAWLGRGLVRIYRGDKDGGLQDLQVAATLEPNRALLRSYLGKAFANRHDSLRAEKELALARKLDPDDPTAWLYLALMNQQENNINTAVRNLEKSIELNDNRQVFRSRLLLDQDRAVRSANLARIYQDAGMNDAGKNEASRAVAFDYANYSAHRFLADSYDALLDPNRINLRYETAWYSELLLSQLLAPVGANNLSRQVSQQEYSRLFEGNHLGLISSTDYNSEGDLFQTASQYGNIGTMSYAVDAEYRRQDGTRPNNDLEQRIFYFKIKDQLTPQDSVMFEIQKYDSDFGDVAQYYNHDGSLTNLSAPSTTFRAEETQNPNLFVGYHREWNPESHTLFWAGWMNDTFSYIDPNAKLLFYRYTVASPRTPYKVSSMAFPLAYESKLNAYSAELQQIWQGHDHTLIVGGRYQAANADTAVDITNSYNSTVLHQENRTDVQRAGVYGYDQWQPISSLLLVGGAAYDWLRFPDNIDMPPITGSESEIDRLSPKAGMIWTPQTDTHIRGAYTRSLGGAYHDTSVRLEPTEVAGFNQAFRSLIPESVAGLAAGTEFETWGAAFDQAFKETGTYLTFEGTILQSEAVRTVGVFTNSSAAIPDSPSDTRESLDFREDSVTVSLNQLVGEEWSFGARYKISDASLDQQAIDIPQTFTGINEINQHTRAILHQANLSVCFNHPSGLFGLSEARWFRQDNREDSSNMPGDDFWQFNLYAGYRFYHRRAEIRLGLLNLTDQDYRLNPLNLYYEIPRERMTTLHFNLNF